VAAAADLCCQHAPLLLLLSLPLLLLLLLLGQVACQESGWCSERTHWNCWGHHSLLLVLLLLLLLCQHTTQGGLRVVHILAQQLLLLLLMCVGTPQRQQQQQQGWIETSMPRWQQLVPWQLQQQQQLAAGNHPAKAFA
jgi:hypothetical protein